MTDIAIIAMAAGFVLALLLAERLGRAMGIRSQFEGSDRTPDRDRTGHILTSIFGLLALLIGFSFGIVLNRYDTRRADVVAEANAISTAHYHAGFVSGNGAALQQSLFRYARHRLEYGQAVQSKRERLEITAARLRNEIAEAGLHLQSIASTPLGSLVLSDTTAVLDLGVQREANIRAKLPWTVFTVLIGLSLVGALMMGFAYPLGGMLRLGVSLFLFVLLALTIVVIIDLDRPARGGTKVDQTPMLRLVEELDAAQAPGGAPAKAQIERTASGKAAPSD